MPAEQLARHGIDQAELQPIFDAFAAGDVAKAINMFSPEMAEKLSVAGTPEECAEQIQRDIQPAGINHVILALADAPLVAVLLRPVDRRRAADHRSAAPRRRTHDPRLRVTDSSYLAELFGLGGATAVVSGGTSGLGAASAVALARAGAKVIVSGRDRERGERWWPRSPPPAGRPSSSSPTSPTRARSSASPSACSRATSASTSSSTPRGVFTRGDAVDVTLDDWERLLRTNVTSTFLLCQRFGRAMIERGRGKIVNFSSTDGFLGVPEQLAYNVSKGAIVQLTRTLGAEWIRHGVNVNAWRRATSRRR